MKKYFLGRKSSQSRQNSKYACVSSVACLALSCQLAMASHGGNTVQLVPSPQNSLHGASHGGKAVQTVLQPQNALQGLSLSNNFSFPNPTGYSATYSTNGFIDLGNEFFQSLGTNDRSCVSCHQPQEGWSITPAGVNHRFQLTSGTDPIFRTNDGSISPDADVSSVASRLIAYNMLLSKGLIRVGISVPQNAEFTLFKVDDPYHYAGANNNGDELSLFRRPLPATNLNLLSTVMWDGRETFSGKTLHFDLGDQANGATRGHAMAAMDLLPSQVESIVNFESALTTTQVFDQSAGWLNAQGAKGSPTDLANQMFYIGINDFLNDSQTKAPFNPVAFNIYDAWSGLAGNSAMQARAAIARGQAIFNTKPIVISGVSGVNDEAAFGNRATIIGTCTTCHNAPNSGTHSVYAPMNIGISDASLRTHDMPLYTLMNKATGQTVRTTDPGRALISGLWKDIGRFKPPSLRGLAARAPYFHNGSATDLRAVVDFYKNRFGMSLKGPERDDLVAFLRSL
jgi:cytochrome c peroxidase